MRDGVNRGRLIWELLARPNMEHVSEVWWTGGTWKKFKRTLAENWWVGVVQLQGL